MSKNLEDWEKKCDFIKTWTDQKWCPPTHTFFSTSLKVSGVEPASLPPSLSFIILVWTTDWALPVHICTRPVLMRGHLINWGDAACSSLTSVPWLPPINPLALWCWKPLNFGNSLVLVQSVDLFWVCSSPLGGFLVLITICHCPCFTAATCSAGDQGRALSKLLVSLNQRVVVQ